MVAIKSGLGKGYSWHMKQNWEGGAQVSGTTQSEENRIIYYNALKAKQSRIMPRSVV